MKRLLLSVTLLAALVFMALRPAQAQDGLVFNFKPRVCAIEISDYSPQAEGSDFHYLTLRDVLELQKYVADLRKCERFLDCVNKRGTKNGPKHCYNPRYSQ
jgi:hypothetical protein